MYVKAGNVRSPVDGAISTTRQAWVHLPSVSIIIYNNEPNIIEG